MYALTGYDGQVETIDEAFGAWMSEHRLAAGISQQDMAEVIGKHQSTIAKMEQGSRPTLLAEALRISRFLREPLPRIDVPVPCRTCLDRQRPGFTCNECGGRPSGARKVNVTDAMLREVADVYRANIDNRPTQAVAAHYGKAHRTAGLYVKWAREAGHLGAASRGRAGEFGEGVAR